jgi:hypothetical protein
MVDSTCSCTHSTEGSVDVSILSFGLHSDLLAYLCQTLDWKSSESSGPLLIHILQYTVSLLQAVNLSLGLADLMYQYFHFGK